MSATLHWHRMESKSATHVPPCWQGLGEHVPMRLHVGTVRTFANRAAIASSTERLFNSTPRIHLTYLDPMHDHWDVRPLEARVGHELRRRGCGCVVRYAANGERGRGVEILIGRCMLENDRAAVQRDVAATRHWRVRCMSLHLMVALRTTCTACHSVSSRSAPVPGDVCAWRCEGRTGDGDGRALTQINAVHQRAVQQFKHEEVALRRSRQAVAGLSATSTMPL